MKNLLLNLVCTTKQSWSKTTNPDPGKLCHFPFVYKGTTYEKCTNASSTYHWCATRVNEDNLTDSQSSHWGECNDHCEKYGTYTFYILSFLSL